MQRIQNLEKQVGPVIYQTITGTGGNNSALVQRINDIEDRLEVEEQEDYSQDILDHLELITDNETAITGLDTRVTALENASSGNDLRVDSIQFSETAPTQNSFAMIDQSTNRIVGTQSIDALIPQGDISFNKLTQPSNTGQSHFIWYNQANTALEYGDNINTMIAATGNLLDGSSIDITLLSLNVNGSNATQSIVVTNNDATEITRDINGHIDDNTINVSKLIGTGTNPLLLYYDGSSHVHINDLNTAIQGTGNLLTNDSLNDLDVSKLNATGTDTLFLYYNGTSHVHVNDLNTAIQGSGNLLTNDSLNDLDVSKLNATGTDPLILYYDGSSHTHVDNMNTVIQGTTNLLTNDSINDLDVSKLNGTGTDTLFLYYNGTSHVHEGDLNVAIQGSGNLLANDSINDLDVSKLNAVGTDTLFLYYDGTNHTHSGDINIIVQAAGNLITNDSVNDLDIGKLNATGTDTLFLYYDGSSHVHNNDLNTAIQGSGNLLTNDSLNDLDISKLNGTGTDTLFLYYDGSSHVHGGDLNTAIQGSGNLLTNDSLNDLDVSKLNAVGTDPLILYYNGTNHVHVNNLNTVIQGTTNLLTNDSLNDLDISKLNATGTDTLFLYYDGSSHVHGGDLNTAIQASGNLLTNDSLNDIEATKLTATGTDALLLFYDGTSFVTNGDINVLLNGTTQGGTIDAMKIDSQYINGTLSADIELTPYSTPAQLEDTMLFQNSTTNRVETTRDINGYIDDQTVNVSKIIPNGVSFLYSNDTELQFNQDINQVITEIVAASSNQAHRIALTSLQPFFLNDIKYIDSSVTDVTQNSFLYVNPSEDLLHTSDVNDLIDDSQLLLSKIQIPGTNPLNKQFLYHDGSNNLVYTENFNDTIANRIINLEKVVGPSTNVTQQHMLFFDPTADTGNGSLVYFQDINSFIQTAGGYNGQNFIQSDSIADLDVSKLQAPSGGTASHHKMLRWNGTAVEYFQDINQFIQQANTDNGGDGTFLIQPASIDGLVTEIDSMDYSQTTPGSDQVLVLDDANNRVTHTRDISAYLDDFTLTLNKLERPVVTGESSFMYYNGTQNTHQQDINAIIASIFTDTGNNGTRINFASINVDDTNFTLDKFKLAENSLTTDHLVGMDAQRDMQFTRDLSTYMDDNTLPLQVLESAPMSNQAYLLYHNGTTGNVEYIQNINTVITELGAADVQNYIQGSSIRNLYLDTLKVTETDLTEPFMMTVNESEDIIVTRDISTMIDDNTIPHSKMARPGANETLDHFVYYQGSSTGITHTRQPNDLFVSLGAVDDSNFIGAQSLQLFNDGLTKVTDATTFSNRILMGMDQNRRMIAIDDNLQNYVSDNSLPLSKLSIPVSAERHFIGFDGAQLEYIQDLNAYIQDLGTLDVNRYLNPQSLSLMLNDGTTKYTGLALPNDQYLGLTAAGVLKLFNANDLFGSRDLSVESIEGPVGNNFSFIYWDNSLDAGSGNLTYHGDINIPIEQSENFIDARSIALYQEDGTTKITNIIQPPSDALVAVRTDNTFIYNRDINAFLDDLTVDIVKLQGPPTDVNDIQYIRWNGAGALEYAVFTLDDISASPDPSIYPAGSYRLAFLDVDNNSLLFENGYNSQFNASIDSRYVDFSSGISQIGDSPSSLTINHNTGNTQITASDGTTNWLSLNYNATSSNITIHDSTITGQVDGQLTMTSSTTTVSQLDLGDNNLILSVGGVQFVDITNTLCKIGPNATNVWAFQDNSLVLTVGNINKFQISDTQTIIAHTSTQRLDMTDTQISLHWGGVNMIDVQNQSLRFRTNDSVIALQISEITTTLRQSNNDSFITLSSNVSIQSSANGKTIITGSKIQIKSTNVDPISDTQYIQDCINQNNQYVFRVATTGKIYYNSTGSLSDDRVKDNEIKMTEQEFEDVYNGIKQMTFYNYEYNDNHINARNEPEMRYNQQGFIAQEIKNIKGIDNIVYTQHNGLDSDIPYEERYIRINRTLYINKLAICIQHLINKHEKLKCENDLLNQKVIKQDQRIQSLEEQVQILVDFMNKKKKTKRQK